MGAVSEWMPEHGTRSTASWSPETARLTGLRAALTSIHRIGPELPVEET